MGTMKNTLNILKKFERTQNLLSGKLTLSEHLATKFKLINKQTLDSLFPRQSLLNKINRMVPKQTMFNYGKISLSEMKMLNTNLNLTSSIHKQFCKTDFILSQQAKQKIPMANLLEKHNKLWKTTICNSTQMNLSTTMQKALLARKTSVELLLDLPQFSTLIRTHKEISGPFFRNQDTFAKFVANTTKELTTAGNTQIASALRASMFLTGFQLTSTNSIISQTLQQFKISEHDIEDEIAISLPIPEIQKQQIIDATLIDSEESITKIEAISEAAQISALTRNVLCLITQCNEVSQLLSGKTIFTPTTRTLKVFAELPWMLSNDRNSFADFIDGLFWILYEGAGAQNLRFMNSNEGLLSDKDCNTIFRIKFLRNKWLRHDPEHGKESDIKKSWGKVTDSLRHFGLNKIPDSKKDFNFLHKKLLEDVIDFLELLLIRLNSIRNETV